MKKYLILEIFLLNFLICFDLIRNEEFPVFQSQLEVVMYDQEEIVFHMKDRGNLTVEIRPTSTRSLNNKKLRDKAAVTYQQSLANVSVPLISSLYYYDKHSVEILRNLLDEENIFNNTSGVLKQSIKRYINEWDELIHDHRTEDFYTFLDHPFPELEAPYITLPKEIEQMYKLVRMATRVQLELPIIIKLLEEFQRQDIVDELVKAEIKSETFFDFEATKMISYESIKLNEMYFDFPVGFFPQDILQHIPIKDLISISTSSFDDRYLREPLKWLTLCRKLLTHKHITETNLSTNNSTKFDDSAIDRHEEFTENLNDTEDFQNFVFTYMDILQNIYSFKHDYALNKSDYGSNFENLFPKLISEVGIEEQSSIQSINEDKKEDMAMFDIPNIPTYKQLCNGIDFRGPEMVSELGCWYDHLGEPWYFLMPVKVEVLFEEPEVLFFHDVLSQTNINLLLQLSYHLQSVSGVHNAENKINETNTILRSSFVSPLKDSIDPRLKQFTRISQYLSGLETMKLKDSESLQVNTYKPGGHYVEHMDSFVITKYPPGASDEEKFRLFNEQHPHGDRIATLLFYLNDVEEGGRTAFTRLGISVAPEKGGALFWFSLFPSGKEDLRMSHAGCPVLKGTKTVVNKWIRYNSQLFRRPCLLEENNRMEFEN